jgi:hypothetical protein
VELGDAPATVLVVLVDEDATVSVDVGTRFVPVGEDDLERILDRLAGDGGTLRLLAPRPRADDGDEPPDRESDAAVGAASWVLGLAHARGLQVTVEDA